MIKLLVDDSFNNIVVFGFNCEHVAATADRGFWLVDPLDGTKEFINGHPDYTVNIAYIDVDGRAQLGVVVVPETGEAFWGNRGGGAFRRRTWNAAIEPMHARVAVQDGDAVVVACSRSHGGDAAQTIADAQPFFPGRTIVLRPAGSSLKIAWVAAGEVDAYVRNGPTCWWDTAAAHAVLDAAGGSLTALPDAIAPLRYGIVAREHVGRREINPFFIARGGADDVEKHVPKRCESATV